MLDPGAREALTEQLRPPAGYRLNHAVGTTFTLDMISALAVPLSFVRGTGEDPTNAVAVLNAVRKVSDRIDVFCQAGLIRVPRHANDLLAVLEPIVHQVRAPRSAALFHPKVWLLEYEADGDLAYRFLCSSRNLTPDGTWDLLVRLDGRPAEDPGNATAPSVDNAPLARFIEALPGMATVPLEEQREQSIKGLSDRVASVAWELPQNIRTLAFRPLGTGETHPADSLVGFLQNPETAVGLNGRTDESRTFGGNRLLVSPFIDDETVEFFSGVGARTVQVYGRGNQLDRLAPETLGNAKTNFHAIDDVGFTADDESETETLSGPEDLRGLHAKAFFTDFDHATHILLGSANATRAAFGRNVEFAVEMSGPKNRIGTEKIAESLQKMPFSAFAGAGGVEENADEAAEWRLQRALIEAASHTFMLDATGIAEGSMFELTVTHDFSPREGFCGRIGLLTLPSKLLEIVSGPHRHTFAGLSLSMVTPFVIIELKDLVSGLVRSTIAQGVLRTDVEGRIDHIVASQLNTAEKLRAFLLLFLTPEESMPLGNGGLFKGQFGAAGAGGSFAGLFEAIAAASTSADAASLFAGLAPVMERLYQLSTDDPEIEDVRRLWNAAVAAVGENQ